MLDSWISYADGFILVYSIDDKESLEVVKGKYEKIIKNKTGQDPKIILAGNKCDLIDKRKIEQSTVAEVCKERNISFMETSALVREIVILFI